MRHIADTACPSCVIQSLQVLFLVDFERCNTSYHETKRVAAERLPQQSGQLGLSVRHILTYRSFRSLLLVFRERRNHLAQSKKRLVDFNSFPDHLLLLLLGVALALTACQVHQLQLALNQGIRLLSVELVHCERQNAVGPRRLVVHQMSCLDLVFWPL